MGDSSENSSSFQDPGWQGLWEAGLAQITPQHPLSPSLATTTKGQRGGEKRVGTAWAMPIPPQTSPGPSPWHDAFLPLPHFLLPEEPVRSQDTCFLLHWVPPYPADTPRNKQTLPLGTEQCPPLCQEHGQKVVEIKEKVWGWNPMELSGRRWPLLRLIL